MQRNFILGITIAAIATVGLGGWYLVDSLQRQKAEANLAGSDQQCTATTTDEHELNLYAIIQGEDFDKAFIADMIAHHEGAVMMAEGALAATDREEIRELATAILTTQSKEIAEMREWQQQWGYPTTLSEAHKGHAEDTMGMENDMVAMTDTLNGLAGDTYDEKFLKLMIEHHRQAVDMAKYAEKGALHQEVKDLGNVIVSAQESEIDSMMQWQEAWGFAVSSQRESPQGCNLL